MKYIPYGHQKIDSADIKEVNRVLKSDWITQGPAIKKFEEALCKYTGARYAVAVSSGTAALHVACLAAGIKKGDEVITSPITFAASANCVLYCGAMPVFADIEKDTANIDPEEIEKLITKKTKAIIPVHFAGHPADIGKIYNLARKHNLLMIEDAAHALGAEYRVRDSVVRIKKKPGWLKVGSCRHSNMAILSFHPVKHITTGEGGAVLTNKKDLYDKLLMYRNHGITKDRTRFTVYGSRFTEPWYYEQQHLGFNYRITDFQCALGINQLKKLNRFIKRRRKIARTYRRRLADIRRIELPTEKTYARSSWHLYPVRLKKTVRIEDKRRIFDAMRKEGIGVQVHYIPIYKHPYYRRLGYKGKLCKRAEEFYHSEISLPLYPAMKGKEIEFVIETLRGAVEKYA